MRWHGAVAGADMLGQHEGDGRRLAALGAPAIEGEAHGVGMRHVARQRFQDGGLQFGGAVSVEQAQQGSGDGAEVVATRGGAAQQVLAGGRDLRQVVGGAVLAGGVFLGDQGGDVGGVLDLGALVVAAAMAGEDLRAIGDAYLVRIGEQRQAAPDMRVRNGVVVAVEAGVRGLADAHDDALEQRRPRRR